MENNQTERGNKQATIVAPSWAEEASSKKVNSNDNSTTKQPSGNQDSKNK